METEEDGTLRELVREAIELRTRLDALGTRARYHLGALTLRHTTQQTADLGGELINELDELGEVAYRIADDVDNMALEGQVRARESINDDSPLAIVRRFIMRKDNAPFLISELKQTLLHLGIGTDWSEEVFAERIDSFFRQIQYDRSQQGHHEQWVRLEFEGQPHVALARIVGDELATEEHEPVSELQQAKINVGPTVQEILMQTQAPMRYKQLAEALASRLRTTNMDAVASYIRGALASGDIFKISIDGSVYYTLDRPTRTEKRSESKKKSDVLEGLTIQEIADISHAILAVFNLPGAHLQQHLTPAELCDKVSVPGVDERVVKRLVRLMQANQGVFVTGQRPGNKGGHRSASQKVFKIGISTQKIKNQLKEGGFRAKVVERLCENIATMSDQAL